MIVLEFPFGITATVHETGTIVQCEAEWIATDEQARGLRATLGVIGDALDSGVEPSLLNKPVAEMIQLLRSLPIKVNRPVRVKRLLTTK